MHTQLLLFPHSVYLVEVIVECFVKDRYMYMYFSVTNQITVFASSRI